MATQLPDLVVYTVTLQTDSIKLGEYLQFSVVIANIGTADSGVITYPGIYLDSTSAGNGASVFFGIKTISNTAPNHSWTYEYTLDTSRLSVGTHTLYLNPDDSNWVVESNETNNWKSVQFSVTPVQVNHAPLVTGKAVSVGVGQSIPLASLFAASDPDGNAIVAYRFHSVEDVGNLSYQPGVGISWDQASRTLTVPAGALGGVNWTGGGGGLLNMQVSASDGLLWSNAANAPITLTQVNHAPVVTGKAVSPKVGQTIDLTSLFSASDPDGNPIVAYRFHQLEDVGTFTTQPGLGITWDQASRTLTVPASALGGVSYFYDASGKGIVNMQISASDGALWSNWANAPITLPTQVVTAPSTTANQIFLAVGENVKAAGIVRVMADFAKAAYDLQGWEDPVINDYSPNAAGAKKTVLDEGWVPLNLSIPTLPATSLVNNNNFVANKMSDGYYTKGNVAALVARSADAVVISFRGTNDNAEANTPGQNPKDPTNVIKPDVDQWGTGLQTMANHYESFKELISAVDAFVNSNGSGINKVYVTGHSLGGAMALKYVSDHKPIGNIAYEAVTFAAPAFVTATWPTGEPFSDDHRITQIEIANDPVPWLQAGSVNRPGQKILFSGNQTLDELDQLIKYPESVSRLPAHPIFV